MPSRPIHIQIDPELELRQSSPSDAEAVFTLIDRSRDFLEQFESPIADKKTLDEVRAMLARQQARTESGDGLSVYLWSQGRCAGNFGLFNFDPTHRRAEVGYWLGQPFAGKGLALRGLTALVDYTFAHLDLHRLQAMTPTTHMRSFRLLERAGFRREGLLRSNHFIGGRFVDEYVYGLLKSDRS